MTTYVNKGLAAAAAKRAGIENPAFVNHKVSYAVHDRDTSPLYNADLRERSAIKGAVAITWDIAAEMLKKGETRKAIIEACVAAGVNVNTARTQYQAFRKASGLVKS